MSKYNIFAKMLTNKVGELSVVTTKTPIRVVVKITPISNTHEKERVAVFAGQYELSDTGDPVAYHSALCSENLEWLLAQRGRSLYSGGNKYMIA